MGSLGDLLQDPLWPGVVAPDRVLSIVQIEQTMCAKNDWNHLTVCKKKRAQARLQELSTKCVYELYIYKYIYVCVCVCVNRIWH